ncbi:MAG TPA: hypothetical protein VH835_13555 [Dongiaceae bacterium]
MEFGIVRECPDCGREKAAYQRRCIYCDGESGFAFPWLHALGIGTFVAGALLYTTDPEFGALIMRLVGYDIAPH